MFANFTIEMIWKETEHLLERVELRGKFTNKSETWHM